MSGFLRFALGGLTVLLVFLVTYLWSISFVWKIFVLFTFIAISFAMDKLLYTVYINAGFDELKARGKCKGDCFYLLLGGVAAFMVNAMFVTM